MTTDGQTVTVRMSELMALQSEAVLGTAAGMLRLEEPLSYHPGGSFGRIIAGAFGRSPAEAYMLLADLLAQLRRLDRAAPDVGHRITLDQLLWGVEVAWPNRDAPLAQRQFLQGAREEVPRCYGETLESLNTA